jgi:Helix-turn-helix domain
VNDLTDLGPSFSDGVILLTPKQAAELCQVSVDRIYEWTYEPDFPVIVGPHQLRIHARLFDEWLGKRAMLGRQRQDETTGFQSSPTGSSAKTRLTGADEVTP